MSNTETKTTTDRFDQTAGAYATCIVCEVELPTAKDGNEHMTETFEAAKAAGMASGHRISVTNPTREQRIEFGVSTIISDAFDKVMDDIERLIDRNEVTEDEAKAALRHHPEFADAWEDYCNENN